jgi:glycosyltransferase involved in cell wall biosynthesis
VILVGRHQKDETVDGIRIAAVPKIGGRLRRMTVTSWQIYRRALEADGDIYHFHDPELMLVGLLLRLRGKRVIYDAHEDLPRTVAYKEYVPRVLRGVVAKAAETMELLSVHKCTAVIGATKQIAERFRDVNPNHVVVHNFPILDELANSRTVAWEERERAVAYVGAITRERGISELREAMTLLSGKLTCRLALAGWVSPASLKEEIHELPNSSAVEYLGVLSRREVANLLGRVQAGIVVLHPEASFMEAKPTKLFEYMCAGIPVVASDFPLWRDIVVKAKCGLLVNPLNPAEIAEAIAYLLTHPREAEEMGRCGRAAAEQLFSWKSEERTLVDLYRSILRRQEAPSLKGWSVPEGNCS